jgi:hypothetical protein
MSVPGNCSSGCSGSHHQPRNSRVSITHQTLKAASGDERTGVSRSAYACAVVCTWASARDSNPAFLPVSASVSSGLVGNLPSVPDLLTTQQSFALIEELDTATTLVEFGLADLREQASEGSHHLPLQLLAQGLERFLKLTYVLAVLQDSDNLPSIREMRRYSHDLERLADALVGLVAPAHRVQVDLEFIRSDGDLRSLLRLLSDFGQESRYTISTPSSIQRRFRLKTILPVDGLSLRSSSPHDCRVGSSGWGPTRGRRRSSARLQGPLRPSLTGLAEQSRECGRRVPFRKRRANTRHN